MTKSTIGSPINIALQIPTGWTPEQALAVFEMIDELRDAIWQCYSLQIQDECRDQRQPTERVNKDLGDPPF
jgi:hypothetical protein